MFWCAEEVSECCASGLTSLTKSTERKSKSLLRSGEDYVRETMRIPLTQALDSSNHDPKYTGPYIASVLKFIASCPDWMIPRMLGVLFDAYCTFTVALAKDRYKSHLKKVKYVQETQKRPVSAYGSDLVETVIVMSDGQPYRFLQAKVGPKRDYEYQVDRLSSYRDTFVRGGTRWFQLLHSPSLREQYKPRVLSDKDLWISITHGVMGLAMIPLGSYRNQARGLSQAYTHVIDLHCLDTYNYPAERYSEVREIYLNHTEGKTSSTPSFAIVMRGGQVIESSISRSTWDIVKLHVCSTLTFYVPYLYHNFVHFIFPCVVSTVSDSGIVPETSLFWKWLQPHVRYNSRTNQSGLNGLTTFGSSLVLDEDMEFWNEAAISNETLAAAIQERSVAFYHDTSGSLSRDIPLGMFRFDLPFEPRYEASLRTPYCNKLLALYAVVRRFTQAMYNYILERYPEERKWMDSWKETILRRFPKLVERRRTENKPPVSVVDIMSQFLFQVSCFHSIDHLQSYRFAIKHQCPSFARAPFSLEEPSFSTWPTDVCKMLNFMDWNGRHYPNKTGDNTMHALDYGFSEKTDAAAIDIQDAFKNELAAALLEHFTFGGTTITMHDIATSIAN